MRALALLHLACKGRRQDAQPLSTAERMPRHRVKQRYIATDTEYLGSIRGLLAGDALSLTTRNYELVKANADDLPALQHELTICDVDDNLLDVKKTTASPCNSPWSSTSMTSMSRKRWWRR